MTTQKNFPVLIRLNAGNAAKVFAEAKTNGGDLRFTRGGTGDTSQLPYELNKYNAANQTAIIWVKTDSVQGNNATQSINMYWGKSSATTTSDSAAVFVPGNGFASVLHLNKRLAGTTLTDATGQGRSGLCSNSVTDTTGVFDSAVALHCYGASGTYTSGDSIIIAGLMGSPATLTMSAWVRVDSVDQANTGADGHLATIFSLADYAVLSDAGQSGTASDSLTAAWYTDNGTATWSNYGWPSATLSGTSKLGLSNTTGHAVWHQGWRQVAAVFAPGTNGYVKLYLNGDSIRNISATNAIDWSGGNGGTATAMHRTVIGKSGAAHTGLKYGGSICEARFENQVRSSDWLKLCFENQQATDSLTSISTTILAPGIPLLSSPGNGATNQSSSPVLSWSIDSAATAYSVQVSTSASFSNLAFSLSGLTATSVTASGLANSLTYYWRVNAVVNGSTTVWSTIWSFATGNLCAAPAITTQPQNTSVVIGVDSAAFTVAATGTGLTYQWERSNDGGNSWANVTVGSGQQSATYKYLPPASDTSSQVKFECYIVGTCGTITSSSAQVSACHQPTITAQIATNPPSLTNLPVGKVVVFQLNATGVPNITYSWDKSVDDIAFTQESTYTLASGSGAIFTYTVKPGDAKVFFRCRVANATCGSAVASDTVMMTVCAAPNIVLQPVNQTAITGQTAAFFLSATGNSLTYQWQFDSTGGWKNIANAIDTFYTTPPQMAAGNAYYRCIVTNGCSVTDTSRIDTLLVYAKAHAYFTLNDSTGIAPLAVKFTDSSTGTLTNWLWNFGTGTSISASSAGNSQIYTYDSAATYQVKLVVTGPSGTDSMTRTVNVYSSTGNPTLMSGTFKNSDSVALTYSDFATLESHQPQVSTIRLWNRSGAIPTSADTVAGGAATIRKTYTLKTWETQGLQYTDSSVYSALNNSDTASGFNTQILWADGTETPLTPQNGCMVVMHSTAQPPNLLTLAANYFPLDTVKFTVGNVQSLLGDTAVADSVILWFGLGADSIPNFYSTQNVQRWPLTHVDSAGRSSFTYVVPDSIFNTYSSYLYAAVAVKGKNNVLSNPSLTQQQVGRPAPVNPLTLSGNALNAVSIQLAWSPTGDTLVNDSIDEIRIYYQKGNPIPLSNQFVGLDSLIASPSQTTITAQVHIQANTRYYFGAQVHKQGLWSKVTLASSTSDSTPSTCKTCINIPNVALFSKGSGIYDSINDQIIFNWSVDTVGTGAILNMQQLELGVTYGLFNSTQTAQGQALPGAQPDSAIYSSGAQVISITGTPGPNGITGTDTIKLGGGIVFDTSYNIYLWLLSTTGGSWTPPDSASSGQVRTGNFFRQQVNYKFESVAGGDTTFWVNRKIRFYVPVSTQASNYAAIIQNFPLNAPDSKATSSGFIVVGQPFFFSSWQASAPFNIGMKFQLPDSPATLSSRFSVNDARIYRWDTLFGAWQVQRSTSSDSSLYASIDTSDLNAPFALMIDTMPPQVNVQGSLMTTTTGGSKIYDTLNVADNVGNLTWQFVCRSGNSTFTLGDSGSQRGSTNNGTFTAPVYITRSDLLSNPSGIQALLLVNDGRNTTVKDVSPSVALNPCATIQDVALQWRPASVSGVQNSFSASHLFGFVDSASPTYDKTKIRLFQYAGSAWTEYSAADSAAFDFKAGNLFWVKTLKAVNFQFGNGSTLPLSDTVAIQLHADGWTDFMLPFNFDVKLGDILAASVDSATPVTALDTLRFYAWNGSAPFSNYTCQPFNSASVDDQIDPTETVSAGSSGSAGYSVYNPLNKAIVLRIPPISAAISTFTSATGKVATQTGWALVVVPNTASGLALNPVYCGLVPSNARNATFYPLPPSLEDVGVAVCNEQTGAVRGVKIAHALTGGGSSYLLNFTNSSAGAQTVSYHLNTIGTLSSQLQTAIFDPVSGTVATPGTKDITVPLDAGTDSYRVLLVGSDAYISSQVKMYLSARLGFDKIYPNPVRGQVHLSYTVPLAQIGSVGFRIFDLSGRTVWSKTIVQQSMEAGTRECLWDGNAANGRPVAPGIYIAQLTGFGLKGNRLNSYERKLMVLP
jgi:PKD repeat protein